MLFLMLILLSGQLTAGAALIGLTLRIRQQQLKPAYMKVEKNN
jgi:hypothetical protein